VDSGAAHPDSAAAADSDAGSAATTCVTSQDCASTDVCCGDGGATRTCAGFCSVTSCSECPAGSGCDFYHDAGVCFATQTGPGLTDI
jgi:hypothetical protein